MSVRIRSRSVGFITGTQMSLIDGSNHVLGPFTLYGSQYAAPVEVKGGQVAIVGSDGTTVADVTTIGPDKAIKVDVVASVGGGGGGTAMTDGATFTETATQFTPTGGEYNTAPAALTTGKGYAARINAKRHQLVQLADSSDNELLGQKAMAGSVPVALASNQSAIPVTQSVANWSQNIAQINGVTPLMGSGIMGTGSLRVTIASDNDVLGVKSTSANLKADIEKMNGVAVSMGTGIMGTGVQRVAIASDNDPVTVKQATSANLNADVNVKQINGVTPLMGSGIMGTGSPRVTIASDNDPVSTKSTAANAKVDVGLINAVTPLMGNGITGTGSLRVTIASDNTSNSNNWNDNIAQINGVAPLMGAGNGGTGSLRVNIASDQVDVGVKQATAANLNAQVVGVAAYGAAASGNVLRAGAKAYDALLTAETAGDQMDLIADKQGRLITAGLAPPDLVNFQATTITASVSETTVVTAGAAGVFNDILGFIVTNSAAAQSKLSLRDATGGTSSHGVLGTRQRRYRHQPEHADGADHCRKQLDLQMGTTGIGY
jgi:hypothetical protein